MASDQELWELTLRIERDHGEAAPLYIAERLTLADAARDTVALALWDAVAERYTRLAGPAVGPPG